MANSVYSTCFKRAHDSSDYLYTVPDGFVALVSCIDVYVGIVVEDGNFTFVDFAGTVLWSQGYDSPGEQYSSWRGKQIFQPGDSFAVYASDTFACSINGDLLTLP